LNSTSDNLLRRRRDQTTRIISGLLQPPQYHQSNLHNLHKGIKLNVFYVC